MYSQIYNCTTDSFKQIFQTSLQVHKCSYDPTNDLRELPGNNDNTLRCHLPLEAKALLFFMHCQENGKTGKIITSDYQMQTFTTPQIPLMGFITVQADVYIDDMLVGSAIAGQSCDISNTADMDNVIQYTSGLAKSRALTNAGFGIVGGTDVDASLYASQNGASLPFTMGNNTAGNVAPSQGTTPPNSAGYAPTNPGTANGFAPGNSYQQPNAGHNPAPAGDPSQVNLFQQLGGQVDALTQAKTMTYPLTGYYQGKTLGSLNTRALEALANKATNDPAINAAVQAARLILEDRNKANGKAK